MRSHHISRLLKAVLLPNHDKVLQRREALTFYVLACELDN